MLKGQKCIATAVVISVILDDVEDRQAGPNSSNISLDDAMMMMTGASHSVSSATELPALGLLLYKSSSDAGCRRSTADVKYD